MNTISECCKYPVTTKFGEEGTNYYCCSHCGKPCDPIFVKDNFLDLSEEEQKEIILKSFKASNEEQRKIMNETISDNWEERFDKKFSCIDDWDFELYQKTPSSWKSMNREVKQFIQSEISLALTKKRAEIRKSLIGSQFTGFGIETSRKIGKILDNLDKE